MELEIAESDLLHLPVRRVILDPILITPKAVARMQRRRVSISDAGEFVQPAACKSSETLEVRRQVVQRVAGQVDRQKISQSAIRGVEIHAGAVGGDPVGAA